GSRTPDARRAPVAPGADHPDSPALGRNGRVYRGHARGGESDGRGGGVVGTPQGMDVVVRPAGDGDWAGAEPLLRGFGGGLRGVLRGSAPWDDRNPTACWSPSLEVRSHRQRPSGFPAWIRRRGHQALAPGHLSSPCPSRLTWMSIAT